MFRIIKGEKIKQQRGNRSLRAISEAAGRKFTDAALSEWESGNYKPKDDKIPALLEALGCSYEDISEPADLSLSK